MSRPADLLDRIADELEVTGRDEYAHAEFGAYHDRPGPGDRNLPLWYFIYSMYYLRVPGDPEHTLSGHVVRNVYELADEGHEAALATANRGRGYWSKGWEVLGVDASGISVRDARGLRLLVDAGDIEGPTTVSETVAIRFPKDVPYASRGFYTFVGDAGFPADPDGRIIRVYVNLDPAAAVELLGRCTERLNDRGVEFGGKVLNDPDSFGRSDPFVLFTSPASAADVVRGVRVACTDLTPKGPPPSLTLEIAPGIGVAEQRGVDGGLSFGQHRCSLIAAGLRSAGSTGGRAGAEQRVERVNAQFTQHGIDPTRPYCCDSVDLMEIVS